MPTDRVLILIETVANLAGIEQAKAGMKGLNATTIGLTLGVAALIVVGKQAIENARKQDDAWSQLEQAYGTAGDSLSRHRIEIENFIGTNKRFIKDQYDVEAAMAAATRAGYITGDMLRIVSIALDIAAVKHEDVSTAVKGEILALTGNGRSLKELGITQEQYNAIMKDKTIPLALKHTMILDLLAAKYKGGAEGLDRVAQSQNAVNVEWEKFTAKLGPPALGIWGDLNEAAASAVGILNVDLDLLQKITSLDPGSLWDIANILNFINDPVGAAKTIMKLNQGKPTPVDTFHLNPGNTGIGNATLAFGKGGRAGGGSVAAGSAYTVGESGPETLVMGDQGGSIVPNGGGNRELHIHMHGTVIDGPAMDRFFRQALQRARTVPGM